MSSVTTITTAPIILHLQGDDGSLASLIDEFLDISEEYQDMQDPLSLQLVRWSGELVEFFSCDDIIDENSVAARIHGLRSIITNPLDGSPLERPRVAGGRIWEEWMLLQIKELFSETSCYSDRACLKEVHPHLFAERILRWRDKIVLSTHPKIIGIQRLIKSLEEVEDKTGWLDKGDTLRAPPFEAIANYIELATNIDLMTSWQKISDKVEKATAHFKEVSKACDERVKEHEASLKAFSLETEKSLASDLDRIKASYNRAIRSLRNSLEESRRENLLLETRIASAESRISSLTSTLSTLEARVHAAEAQNQANYHAAHSRGGGGCSIM